MKSKINLIQEAKNLLNNLNGGDISASAYDTAWVARIPDKKNPEKPMFLQTLDWLIKNQYSDGSWGGQIEYYHDRIICTLSAIIALSQYNKNGKYQKEIEKGINYLKKNIKNLKKDHHETMGFELLFPKLIKNVRNFGLKIPGIDQEIKKYQEIQEKKIKLAPDIYSRSNLIIHSAEFLGNEINLNLTKKRQDSNGSLAGSPSATTYFFIKSNDKKALNYLKKIIKFNNKKISTLYPIDIFEKSWPIYNFLYSNSIQKFKFYINPYFDYLNKVWTKKGVCHTKYFYITDLDDAAVVFKLLKKEKLSNLHPTFLKYFEKENHFQCWPHERDLSITPHIHLLDMLKSCPEYSQQKRMIKKILKVLYRTRIKNSYWSEKWHISPYYPTSHAILANIGIDNKLVKDSINWIVKTQKKDGSWGFFREGTCEETAYCLQSLIYYHKNIKPIAKKIIKKAINYLYKNYSSYAYFELWIGKSLYCPKNVVKSAIISALLMYEEIK